MKPGGPSNGLFTRLAHVCLNVRDLAVALEFYRRLGFDERFSFTRGGRDYGRYLALGDSSFLEIFEDPQRGPVVNNGLAHFCLETRDLDALMAQLDARGVPYTPPKLGCDHTRQIWLKDPDGNAFEVHQYTPASLQTRGGTVEADW